MCHILYEMIEFKKRVHDFYSYIYRYEVMCSFISYSSPRRVNLYVGLSKSTQYEFQETKSSANAFCGLHDIFSCVIELYDLF